MRYLLDTHVWLWSLSDPGRMSTPARKVLVSDDVELFLSPLSVWETMVLAGKGRIELGHSPGRWVREALGRTPATMAEITHEIAMRAEQLAGLATRNSVDRFLAATCLVNGLTLVTADRQLRRYRKLPTLW